MAATAALVVATSCSTSGDPGDGGPPKPPTAAVRSESAPTSEPDATPEAEPTPSAGVFPVPGATRPTGSTPPLRQVRWRDYGGAFVPGSSAGPSTTTTTGATGWARDGGAWLAAAHYAVVFDGAQDETVWSTSVATALPAGRRAAARAVLAAEAAKVAAEREQAQTGEEIHDGPTEPAWAPNIRVVGYSGVMRGERATVTVWARPDGQDGAWWRRTVVVQWTGGDWRLVLSPGPTSWAMSDDVPSDLSAFTDTPATTNQEAP